jgi:galactonate dehydratase
MMEKTNNRVIKNVAEPDIVRQRRSRLELSISLHRTKTSLTAADSAHAIKEVKAWTLREAASKRTYTVFKVLTNSGMAGYGESAALATSEFEEAKKIVIGMPVTSFEVAAPLLSRYPKASAGLNIAMLDVASKIAKVPLFQFLGGPTRSMSRALTPLTGNSDSALINAMNQALKVGFKAFIVPVPPPANPNSGQAYVSSIVKRLEALRAAGGAEADFVLDGANMLSPGDAQMVSAAIEPFYVLWFNEPCNKVSLGSLSKISNESVVPLGIGRHLTEGREIQDLLREDAVDIIRPQVGLTGISQIRRMAALAETYYVAVGPTHEGGPIGTAAALHLSASLPNFFIQEIPFSQAKEDQQMRVELTGTPVESIKDGFAQLPIGHGLGITVNEKILEKNKIR